MEHRLHNTVYARLDAIAAAEKITRFELGELSRELLVYVCDTNDIDIVNRLFVVLTPMNRQAAILYFKHFLPWNAEEDKDGTFNRFGKKFDGAKKLANRMKAIDEWLSNEANNIWSWANDNIEIKQKDFGRTIENAIKKALKGDEKSDTPALSMEQIIAAVFAGGVSLDDMLLACMVKDEERKAVEAEVQQAA